MTPEEFKAKAEWIRKYLNPRTIMEDIDYFMLLRDDYRKFKPPQIDPTDPGIITDPVVVKAWKEFREVFENYIDDVQAMIEEQLEENEK